MEQATLKKSATDALEIYNNGAVNPTAICNVMVSAIAAARERVGTDMTAPEYAPVRLIMAQLWYLAGKGIGSYVGVDEDMKLCEAYAKGEGA